MATMLCQAGYTLGCAMQFYFLKSFSHARIESSQYIGLPQITESGYYFLLACTPTD